MKFRFHRSCSLLLVLALALTGLLAAPAPEARASDSGDTGVAISVGLACAVVAVYALVSLQSDIERYSQNDDPELEAVMERAIAAAERSPVTIETVTKSAEWETGRSEVAGAAIGLRTTF